MRGGGGIVSPLTIAIIGMLILSNAATAYVLACALRQNSKLSQSLNALRNWIREAGL